MIVQARLSNLSKTKKKNCMPVVFPYKSSNESAIMVIVSGVVASVTLVSSVVARIVVISGVVFFSEDNKLKLQKEGLAVKLSKIYQQFYEIFKNKFNSKLNEIQEILNISLNEIMHTCCFSMFFSSCDSCRLKSCGFFWRWKFT